MATALVTAARERLLERRGSTGAGPGEAWRMCRRHWALLVLLTAGATLRIATHAAYQPALIYIDSIRYLELTRTLEPGGLNPLGYPVLLLSWILPFRDLALVALVQHVLGLAMGAGIYALLIRWNVRRWLAAAASAPVLLDAYQLQIEHNIMSDTLFQALLLGGLAALLWSPGSPSLPAISASGLLFGLAVTVRSVGMALVVVAVCAVVLVWRSPRRRRIGVLALILACFAAPLLLYSSWSLYYGKGFRFSSAVSGTLLYARVAPIADCDGLRAAGAPDHVIRLCPREPIAARQGPDYYAHDPGSPSHTVAAPRSMTRQEALYDFGVHVILNQPLDVAYAVAHDFAKGFAPVRTAASTDVPLERWRFQERYPAYSGHDPAQITREYGGEPPAADASWARFLRGYQDFGYMPGPLSAAGMIAGLLGAAGLGRRRTAGPPGLRAACLLPSIAGIALLTMSAASMFSWRYQLPALVLFPLAGALGVTALIGKPESPDQRHLRSSPR
ncbi:hypothetical protein ITP53_00530 [Nonomuraea sp. K274]|uniref:Dolichyl-phosphate-mannose-protein mannosyltransferase n=1 Tax=Nonomuraea cypriaca TaxID=1187855 RepID=A0A931A140_9ACTN|nr:hypothetical protein [Nonomuraea cypriaca]MBF8184256.1 hypothetical protein [Nonomuraea cypriaca]